MSKSCIYTHTLCALIPTIEYYLSSKNYGIKDLNENVRELYSVKYFRPKYVPPVSGYKFGRGLCLYIGCYFVVLEKSCVTMEFKKRQLKVYANVMPKDMMVEGNERNFIFHV